MFPKRKDKYTQKEYVRLHSPGHPSRAVFVFSSGGRGDEVGNEDQLSLRYSDELVNYLENINIIQILCGWQIAPKSLDPLQ